MKGENHNPLFPKIEEYSEEMPPQDRVVFDCKIDLAGLPDETYGVEVLDWQKESMEEVVGDEPLEEHQFRVDYTHGYLYFHPVHNKKTVTIQKYYSRGMLYFPASRVYSIDEHGRVDINTTLQDYIDSIKTWIFQGDYQTQQSYTANNSVYSDGSIYIAKQDVPINKIPKKNPEYWQPMSSGFVYRGEYDSSETYYPREIVAYKKGYYACLQEVGDSAPDSGTAWQEIVSVDSIYEAWQGADGNGGLKQEIAETLERVESTRDEIVQEWEGTENSAGLKQQLEDMLNGDGIIDNLTSTSTTSPLSANQGKVLNDTKADKQNSDGGFAGGAGASAEHGGAIGMETKTGNGFAGGFQAKTVDANNNAIDAIQLGTGANSTEKTLQIYDKQLLDAEGHIPDDRIPQLAEKQTEWIVTTAGTGTAYTATLDPAPESLYIGMQITIIPHVSSSSSSATLNVNDTGAKYFRQRGRTTGTLYSPNIYSFLAAGKPTTLIYDGTYWVMTEYSRPNWNDIKDKPESILSAENIIAGDNVTVTTNGNDVTISASGGSGVNVVDNLTSTSTTSALSANQGKVLDEKKADKKNVAGGFAGGIEAFADEGGAVGNCASTNSGGAIGIGANSAHGGAVGKEARADSGGAIGQEARADNGGAVGLYAKTGNGFAGGLSAATKNSENELIDAIQLGTGTNTTPKTLQVYDYLLMKENGKIPFYRLSETAGKNLRNADEWVSYPAGTAIQSGVGAEIFNDYRLRQYNSRGIASAGNIAVGTYSHAEGECTSAIKDYCHAEGCQTIASGLNSHAEGRTTEARNFQHVQGRYNKISNGPTNIVDTTGDIFIIGNGTDEARSNALRTTTAGKTYGAQAFSGSGADYAEFFEWQDGNPNDEDRRGLFVTLDGEKIKKATNADDFILGVVSVNACFEGDSQSEAWKGMYLKDVFGEKVTEVIEVPEKTDKETGVVTPAHTETRWILNDEYDPNEEYVPRENRKEWSAVGLIGKLVVVDDGTCEVNGYCKPSAGGIGTKSEEKTAYRVMKRLDDTHVRVVVK